MHFCYEYSHARDSILTEMISFCLHTHIYIVYNICTYKNSDNTCTYYISFIFDQKRSEIYLKW